jgi:hypothetical protein
MLRSVSKFANKGLQHLNHVLGNINMPSKERSQKLNKPKKWLSKLNGLIMFVTSWSE